MASLAASVAMCKGSSGHEGARLRSLPLDVVVDLALGLSGVMVARQKPHVFLSHVRENARRVKRLAADLEAHGVATWLDRDKIKPAEPWKEAIEDAIRSGPSSSPVSRGPMRPEPARR